MSATLRNGANIYKDNPQQCVKKKNIFSTKIFAEKIYK